MSVKRMLKVLRLTFLQKNVILSRERAGVFVSRDSFNRVPCLQCLSDAIVSFVNDCGIVKVNFMIKSPCMFCNVRTFSTLFCISDMFLSSGAK